ncbi:amidase [Elioraea sp.]|uniref:amidase n=1 Tax=Elioraea sp. TaxID=2185103 RepID=UPI0025BE7EE5|nr:amidase [Elioraea sp.]
MSDSFPLAHAAHRIAAGEVSATQLLEVALQRVTASEARVHAFTILSIDAARAAAAACDTGPVRGPLHGVPIAVKDVFDTADLPTAYGSPIWQGHRPRADASAVALARAAGAVILGKTVTTEFASYTPGPTTNPHDIARTPGGSSSGSAAAVAAGMVTAAFGTQTAGSIIRPAAYCGVVGYKPSFGVISRAGMKPLAESFDTAGTLACTVADAALLAGVAAGRHDLAAPVAADAWPTIGLFRSDWWDEAEPAQRAAIEAVAEGLRSDGARVVDLAAPAIPWVNALHSEAMAWEAARAFAWERAAQPHALSPKLAEILTRGAAMTPARLEVVWSGLARARAKLSALFERCDIVLTPPAPGQAPLGLDGTGSPTFNRIWSLLGGPCLTLPCGRSPDGMPLGAQLVALPGRDASLLGMASRVEKIVSAMYVPCAAA